MHTSTWIERTKEEINHWCRRDWSYEAVGKHWDDTEDYDHINEETYSYYRRFIDGYRFCNCQDQSRVLDFCARTGNGTTYFHAQGKVASAVCADVSGLMGVICRQRLKDAGLEQSMWVPILEGSFPFADESFDLVLCFETVEHFPDPGRIIAELGRLTRPGGLLVVTTPNVLWEPVHALAAILEYHHSEGPHRFIPIGKLRTMVREAGYTIEEDETTVLVPGGPRFLIRIGEWIEKNTSKTLMPLLGLRRIIIGRKTDPWRGQAGQEVFESTGDAG